MGKLQEIIEFSKSFDILYIVGPTASGKSSLSMDIARNINGEILNSDSQQIYKQARILTACPSADDFDEIMHHNYCFYNIYDDFFNVNNWLNQCFNTCENVIKNNKKPIICGGTGLYANSVINDISSIPDIDNDIRERCRNLANDLSMDEIYSKLCEIDNISAKNIKKNDLQRCIRAIEVFEQTGKPISYYHSIPNNIIFDKFKIGYVYIEPSKDILWKRINNRTLDMIDDGMIFEIEQLLEYQDDFLDKKIMGGKYVIDYINNQIDIDTMIDKIQTQTRQYSKRQKTFLKNKILSSGVDYIVVENEFV